MYKTKILIISERKELSFKYKKIIETLEQEVICTSSLSSALSIIKKDETEFIIISDTIKERLSDFIKKIRILTYNFRPIIIASSKSQDLDDKLEALDSGADDFIEESIPKSEFKMRFMAHLRRYLESRLDNVTKAPDKLITQKALSRSLEYNGDYSYLLMRVEGFFEYQRTHGEIAAENVLKTLCAIVNSFISKDDFLGYLGLSDFMLITRYEVAQKVAPFLTFAFDNILNKFYSESEFEDNFTMQGSENTKEIKKPLMKLFISSVQKAPDMKTYRDIIRKLEDVMSSLQNSKKSNYIIDRVRLMGESKNTKEKKVLVFEKDPALSCLIKNVFELNNIIAQFAYDEREFMDLYSAFSPDVVLLDWGYDKNNYALELARRISKDNIKLIFSSSYLNKKEILRSGADIYIPKPYEIEDIVRYIKNFFD